MESPVLPFLRNEISHRQGFYSTSQIANGGLPEKKCTLTNLIVRSGMKLKYIVDPAEEKWMHEIVVENTCYSDPTWPFPICRIAGVRACSGCLTNEKTRRCKSKI